MLRIVLLFLVAAGIALPWPNGYQYRRTITVASAKVTATQTNFPVTVSGTYSYLATRANGGKVSNANGYDIIFTSDAAGTTKLNWELEQYTATTGQLIAWVKIPSLTTTTAFYMFYGSPSVSTFQSTASGVWDTNYRGVWHLKTVSSALNTTDSSANALSLTNNGVTAGTGEVDGDGVFSGASQYATSASSSLDVGSSDYTIECWLKAPATAAYATAVSKRQGTSPFTQWEFGVGSVSAAGGVVLSQTLFLYESLSGGQHGVHTTNNYADGNWHHVQVARASEVYSFYIDGATPALTNDSTAAAGTNLALTNSGNFNLGYDNGGTYYYNGSLDEVRLTVGTARSATWESTSYNNQSSPSTFYTVGSEQASPLPLAPIELLLTWFGLRIPFVSLPQ